jgi:hypothetical protein
MKSIKIKTILLTLSLLLFGLTGVLLIHAENEKKQLKLAKMQRYYADQQNAWLIYQTQLKKQLDDITNKNISDMAKAQKEYNDLLEKQKAFIALNTEQNNNLTNTTINPTPTPQPTNTQKQNVTVKKPKSTPRTQAS